MLESQEAERAVSKVRSALDEAGAEDIAITMAEGTIFTVEDAAGILGVPPSEILKSLVFLVDGNPCLVLMSRVNRVDARAAYDITWTSTNGRSGTLEALTTTTTIDLPVAEIQTINRPTPTH